MLYSITIEINPSDFDKHQNFHPLVMKDVFLKYNFSISTHTQNQRLVYLAKELSLLDKNTLAFNACYNLKEVLFLDNELKKHNLSLDTVYIPSPERVEKRKLKALENARLYGRWIGSDELVIDKNFTAFRKTLNEIKNGLKNEPIQVIEC